MMKRAVKYVTFIILITIVAISCSTDAENDSLNESSVLGTWRVMEVKISDAVLTQRTPADEIITLTFEDGGTFIGSTSVNAINGRFDISGTTLSMLEFTTTEAGDTTFAGSFYSAIQSAIAPNDTAALFGFSFDSQDMIFVFGNNGQMVLEKQE